MNGNIRPLGPFSGDETPLDGVMEKELADIVRRLQPDWPGVDVASFVVSTYRRLAENARVTIYLPLLTEHLTRDWLNERRRHNRASTAAGSAA